MVAQKRARNSCVGPGRVPWSCAPWMYLMTCVCLLLPICVHGIDRKPANEMSAFACEGSILHITCSPGEVLRIVRANYGRFTLTMCNQWGVVDKLDTQCMASNSTSIVSNRCDGRMKCDVRGHNRLFGDPCRGTSKYLEVHFWCERTASPTTMSSVWTSKRLTNDSTAKPTQKPVHVCQATQRHGVYWPTKQLHEQAKRPCPQPLIGEMYWECGLNGWIGEPDLTLCRKTGGFTGAPNSTPSIVTIRPGPTDGELPVIKYCHSKEKEGVYWPTVMLRVRAERPCPEGKIGMMYWTCGKNGWIGEPDVSNCVSKWVDTLGDTLNEDDVDIEEAAADLVKETEEQTLWGADLIMTTKSLIPQLQWIARKQFNNKHINKKEKKKKVDKFSQAIIKTGSNLLSRRQKASWNTLPRSDQKKVATSLVRSMESAGFEIAQVLEDEESIITSDENLLMEVSSVDVHFQQTSHLKYPSPTAAEEWLKDSDHIIIPKESLQSSAKNGIVKVVYLVYQNLDTYMNPELPEKEIEEDEVVVSTQSLESTYSTQDTDQQDEKRTSFVNSKIFSASINGQHEPLQLKKPITFLLRHIDKVDIKNFAPTCAFWKFDESGESGNWSSDGCRILSTNISHTTCECDHLTNFAVLMDYMDTKLSVEHEISLRVITYVGCIISIICLSFSLFTFCFFKNLQCDRNTIHKNLVLTLMIAELFFLIGIGQTQYKILCAVFAGLLHYLFLAAFGWMCLEGIQLYVMLIEVFDSGKSRAKFYYLSGYGIPALVVAISAAIQPSGYGTDRHCWLRVDNGFIWSFVGPVAAVILLNIIMLSIAVYMMCRHANTLASALRTKEKSRLQKISRDQSSSGSGNSMLRDQEKTRMKSEVPAWLKGAAVLVVLLGLTWAFGILYISEESVVMAYVFTILNSLQGLFIFLFHCLLNEKVKKEYKKLAYRSTWLPTCLRDICIGSTSSSHSHNNSSSSGGHLLKFWSGRRRRKSSTSTCSTPTRGNKRRSDVKSDLLDSYSSRDQTTYTHNGHGRHSNRKSNGHGNNHVMYSKETNGIVGDLSIADCSVIDSEFVSEYCQKNLQICEEEKQYSSGSEDDVVTEDPTDKHSLSALSMHSTSKAGSEFASCVDIDSSEPNQYLEPNHYSEPMEPNHYSELVPVDIRDTNRESQYAHAPLVVSQNDIQRNYFNKLHSNPNHHSSDEVHYYEQGYPDRVNKDYKYLHGNNNSINVDLDGTQDPLLYDSHNDSHHIHSNNNFGQNYPYSTNSPNYHDSR